MLLEFLREQITKLGLPVAFRAGDNAECATYGLRFYRHAILYIEHRRLTDLGIVYGRCVDGQGEVICHNYSPAFGGRTYLSYKPIRNIGQDGQLTLNYYAYHVHTATHAFMKLIQLAITPIAFSSDNLKFFFTVSNRTYILRLEIGDQQMDVPLVSHSGDVLLTRQLWTQALRWVLPLAIYTEI